MTVKVLEELQEEIVSAIKEYCEVRPVRGMAFGRYHDVRRIVETFAPEHRALIWQFYDTVEILCGSDRVVDFYRAIGRANQSFFWLTIFGWALCEGQAHYSLYHRGNTPEDTKAWLHAVLVADDLYDVSKQEF